jgi:hypothetical protein
MTGSPAASARAKPPPELVLCRQCVEYVFAGTVTCPHCGRDARKIGARYRAGPYRMLEAFRLIDRASAAAEEERSSAGGTHAERGEARAHRRSGKRR